MSVNIEHINIDQATEYAIENILTLARTKQLSGRNTYTSETDSGNILPEGDLVGYLTVVLNIGRELRAYVTHREYYALNNDIRNIKYFLNKQINFKTKNDEFERFPTQPDSFLVAEYKKTFDK